MASYSTEENLLVVVKQELKRLGVPENNIENQQENKKPTFYQQGSKFLGFGNNNSQQSKGKTRNHLESPKTNDALKTIISNPFTQNQSKTPSKNELKVRRNAPKSPFSSKNRSERKSARKKAFNNVINCKVNESKKEIFGQELNAIPLCSTQLNDGTIVSVPEFIVDVSNLIQRNICLEGIFRKAGSAQRQNDIKNLLASGEALPLSVHPIDAACLLKQFLRSMPTPLLSHHVHFLMTKCLDLPVEEQQEALSLCSLLLTNAHKDLLAYILELMSAVATASDTNLMDARNLAIVLAPNLLPVLNNGGSSKKSTWFTEDHMLSSTISVIERLIAGASGICRISEKIVEAVQNREKSQSMENLADAPSTGSQKKKRRSASIHRLMNGIRRVVHGGNAQLTTQPLVISSPIRVATPRTPKSFSDRTSPAVNMNPNLSPMESGKRKSDTFESPEDMLQKFENLDVRPKKKPRMESNEEANICVFPPGKRELSHLALFKTKSNKPFNSLVTVKEDCRENVRRSLSMRESRNALHVSSDSPSLSRRKSIVGLIRKSNPSTTVRTPVNRRLKVVPLSPSTPSTLSPLINHPNSSILLPLRATSKSNNDPDGSESTPLGPRGAPDGSECNLRDSSPISDPLYDLEKHYVEVKSAVETMENEIDRDNMNYMKESFEHLSTSNLSCSQIIHDAYERMKIDTKELDSSPAEKLSRRLGRELKLRRRKSGEPRVMRSPSERKIGSIRRRSKELEQQAAKQATEDQLANKLLTPKLKANLLFQSPQTALKRGRPNSLRSGLPMVVKPANTVGLPGMTETPPKAICIRKRILNSSPRRSDSDSSFSSTRNQRKSSITESFSASFGEVYNGPMTRRRSSASSNIVPPFNLNSADNSFGSSKSLSTTDDGHRSVDKEFLLDSSTKSQTKLAEISPVDASEESGEWISAAEFIETMTEEVEKRPILPGGNRPSIAALKKQKKVTANVQLFSQLQVVPSLTPSHRRSSRYKSRTPSAIIPMRTAASERRQSRTRMSERLMLTPQDSRPSRSRLTKGRSPLAIVSPMKSRNPGFRTPTPRIVSHESHSIVKRLQRMDTFVIPSGLTPLPPKPFRPPVTPRVTAEYADTPPRLPPRKLSLSAKKLSLHRY